MSWIWRWRKKVEKLRDSLSKSTQKSSGSLSIRLHHGSQISFASVTKVKRCCGAQVSGVATVNVNILPLVVTLVPDAGLFWLVSVSVALSKWDEESWIFKGVEFSLPELTYQCIASTERRQCRPYHRPTNGRADWGWSCWWLYNSFPALQK